MNSANAAAEVEVVATKDPAVGLGRATVAGYQVQVGPMKWLAEERAALMARTWTHFEARQLGATIVSVVIAPPALFGVLRRALRDWSPYCYLRFEVALSAARARAASGAASGLKCGLSRSAMAR